MGAENTATLGGANHRPASSAYPNTSRFRLIDVIASKAKALWANKVALELSVRAGVSVRTAENYLAGDRSINGNALARLLQSDVGPEFLQAIVDDLPPTKRAHWEREFDRAALRADLRARQIALLGRED